MMITGRADSMPTERHFDQRLPLDDAWGWLDACPDISGVESVRLEAACGRVLAVPVFHPADRPDQDRVLCDGFAVQAELTLGASLYNPILLTLVRHGQPVSAGSACRCHAGQGVPLGADAILPLDAGESTSPMLTICAPVARGAGIGRTGQTARSGDCAIPAQRHLRAPQIALVASLGVTHLTVRRRPAVALILAGAKPPAVEALAVALSALIRRDGGIAELIPKDGGLARALAAAAAVAPDLTLVVGRSGWGEDDTAPHATVAAGGQLDHHGVALTPGGSAGLGRLANAPLLLLPGDPLSALATYEVLAGRLVRRLAGRPADWPAPLQRRTLLRKIASPIGVSEFIAIVCHGPDVEPLAPATADGLAIYAKADGFLIVPAELEGYKEGAPVEVVTATRQDIL